MKYLFIPVEYKLNLDKSEIKKLLNKIPNKIILIYTSQYKKIAQEIKQFLKKDILGFQQVLGCTKLKPNKKAKAILYIGSGMFHPVSIARTTKLPVYTFYPETNSLNKISKEQIEKLNKKQKACYLNYVNSDKIGILISIKPGQNRLKKAISLKKQIKNKKSYLFIGNNLNLNEIENFNIKSWINTACPRLDLDNKIINYSDL